MTDVKHTVFLLIMGLVICSAGCESNRGTSKNQRTENQSKQTEPKKTAEAHYESESGNAETQSEGTIWTAYSENDLPDLERRVSPSKYTVWQCNYNVLMRQLEELPANLMLPLEEGMTVFNLENSSTMAPELAAKFPQLKTLKGVSETGWTARVDTNDEGLFAEFKQNGEVYVLSPMLLGSTTFYILYNKTDLETQPRDEDFEKK